MLNRAILQMVMQPEAVGVCNVPPKLHETQTG
jgi:hypothetical protein